jgi:hypothetical protein
MSAEPPSYSALYVRAWTILSIAVSVVLLGMFVLGPHLLHAGQIVWALIRWLASPII